MKILRKVVVWLFWLCLLALAAYSVAQGRLLAATGWMFGAAVSASVLLSGSPPGTPKKRSPAPGERPEPLDSAQCVGLFRKKYAEMLARLDITESGGLVSKMSSVFSLLGVNILHFCWRDGERIYFFPQWDSIEGYLSYPEYMKPYRPGDEDNLYILDIPVDSIEYFRRGEDHPDAENPEALERGKTVLQYYNAVDQMATLLFSADSYEVFEDIIPEKEYTVVLAEKYPKSARQILNIRDQLQSLKDLWGQNLITDEDYAEKRKKLLMLL